MCTYQKLLMKCTPEKHHRRSIRLKGWDYTSHGCYFVTIVAHERICWFDTPAVREVVEHEWAGLPNRFPTLGLDAFVVMPNHVHFIIWLNPPDVGAQTVVGAQFNCAPTNSTPLSPMGQRFQVHRERPTLGQVVRTFKAATTRRIRQGHLDGFAWQRNYYERVVRNERELQAIRQYIHDNPACWAEDIENPNRRP